MDKQPRRWWHTALKVLFWTIAVPVVVLVGIATYPWPDSVWWFIAFVSAMFLLQWFWNDHTTFLRLRHEELLRRLEKMDYRLSKIETAVDRIENPDHFPQGPSKSQTGNLKF